MTTPIIITTAITGAIPRKADNPAVPTTPSEQIKSTHEAFKAGCRRLSMFMCETRTKIRHRI